MAFNNGIVVVADEIHFGRTADGSPGHHLLVEGHADSQWRPDDSLTLLYQEEKSAEIDLRRVRVPAKIIVLRTKDAGASEGLISDISKYANSQNSVKLSDLSANKPFHVRVEELSVTTYCPDGVSRWFYERAAGSYRTMLAHEGTTPARLKKLRKDIPSSRKITKTDLAKFLNAWDCKPYFVSFGAQKNFQRFMEDIGNSETARTLNTSRICRNTSA